MSSGVLTIIVLVLALLALVAIAFVAGRRLQSRPVPEGPAVLRRDGLGPRVRALLGRGDVTEDDWRQLEEALIRADTGTRAARELVTRVREAWEPGSDPEAALIQEVAGMFAGDPPLDLPKGLAIVMVVGVNGTGKTTTIGKLAHHLKGRHSVAVAASDTFRAAAVEQLQEWAERAGVAALAQGRGADPGAVAFDAVEAAKARGHDALIVDTAGRIHTKQPLMEELRKVRRTIEKAAAKPPDEVLLVVDATTGQNGISQAKSFLEAVEVTGIVLTKLDGAAKGGVVLAIREELGVPVKLVGTGEGIDDLEPFVPLTFAEELVRG